MDQSPTPIICDPTIWYRLSDGRTLPDQVKDLHLVGTYINGYEFCSSRNVYSDYSQLRAAVMAFDRYAKGFCVEIPFEYMKAVSGHESDDS